MFDMNQNHHLSEKTYSIGDTVGIRIHKVDRANTDSNILPCKVLEIKKGTDSKSVYKIFSKDGILKTYYSDEDLVELRTVCFPGLNSINPNLLLEISHIQAESLVESWILLVQIWISWFVLVDIGILIYTGLNPVQIRIPFLLVEIGIPICTSRIPDPTGFQFVL